MLSTFRRLNSYGVLTFQQTAAFILSCAGRVFLLRGSLAWVQDWVQPKR